MEIFIHISVWICKIIWFTYRFNILMKAWNSLILNCLNALLIYILFQSLMNFIPSFLYGLNTNYSSPLPRISFLFLSTYCFAHPYFCLSAYFLLRFYFLYYWKKYLMLNNILLTNFWCFNLINSIHILYLHIFFISRYYLII